MIMLVLILICITQAVFWFWYRKKQKSTEPPSLQGGWPILGHVPILFGDSCLLVLVYTHHAPRETGKGLDRIQKFIDLWRYVMDLAHKTSKKGGVVSVHIGLRNAYVVTDPDDAQTVANTCIKKDRLYNFAKPWLGEGLATGDYKKWKVNRKLLQPAFSQIVLDGFMVVFNSQSRKLVKDLEMEVGKGPFDHFTYTRHNALEAIFLAALGVAFADQDLSSQYEEAVEDIFDTMMERFQKIWLHNPYTFKLSGLKKKQDACLKILHNMSDNVLKRRKIEIKCKSITNLNNNEKVPDKKMKFKPFLDFLLELSMEQGVFTDREIRNHVDTMIVGGHDTSAIVLTFTLLLIGANPYAQEKLYTELEEVFEGSDRDVEKADLPKLVYLEAVLKESMRIYSIAPVTARWLDRDVKLKNCTLSSGRTCFIFIYGIHRHPVWGVDAEKFNPDRWLNATTLPDSPNAFAAFMTGRRFCIGKNFALMSMKTTLAHLLRRYRIMGDDSQLVLKLDVMLKPASGYFISLENRT